MRGRDTCSSRTLLFLPLAAGVTVAAAAAAPVAAFLPVSPSPSLALLSLPLASLLVSVLASPYLLVPETLIHHPMQRKAVAVAATADGASNQA